MSKKKGNKDDLGARMKGYYEQTSQTKLLRRTPVVIRVDGKAFHTFTKGFEKPFDSVMMKTMQDTMKFLCEHIQGCVLGYTQSDEITLILVDYKHLDSSAWFDYKVQKMASVAASMATLEFNRRFRENARPFIDDAMEIWNTEASYNKPLLAHADAYERSMEAGAMFDARCFNVPREEVTNLVYWRQIDAAKNSVQMLGRAYFTHKQLQNKHSGEIQDMLMEEHGVNWNDLPVACKRGSCCVKGEKGWVVDTEIPQFKGDGRTYIEELIKEEEE